MLTMLNVVFMDVIILSPLFDGTADSVSPSGLDASAFRGTI